MELAQAPLLRALAAKHCLGVICLKRSCTLRYQVVLYHRAHHTSCALGAQRQTLLGLELGVGTLLKHARKVGTREHAEHLFANHVGRLTNAMHKHINLLDGRSLDGRKTVRLKNLGSHLLHALPGTHLAPNQVFGTLCLLCLHVRSPPHSQNGALNSAWPSSIQQPPIIW